LIGPACEDAILTGLDSPYCGFFECESVPPRDEIEVLLRETAREGGLVLSLTTRSAWRLDLTGLIATALFRRLAPLGPERRAQIERQVSDAVSRALVEDNLGLDSAPRGSLSGLIAYLDQIEIRLRDPLIASRRLDLRILPQSDGQVRLVGGGESPSTRDPRSLLARLAGSLGLRAPQLATPFLAG